MDTVDPMPEPLTPARAAPAPLRIIDLGRMAYAPAFEKQREVHAAVVAGDAPPTVLLVEHDPVITISRRKAATSHVLADARRLAELGIDVQSTDRGGDVTYHGPGQLVAYPILRLADLRFNISRYLRWLEQIVIDTVAVWGVRGVRDAANTGVWVDVEGAAAKATTRQSNKATDAGADAGGTDTDEASHPAPFSGGARPARSTTRAKLCAIGVRVSRGVSMHGLALNVSPEMSHFNTIVPCGLAGCGVTSLGEVLGQQVPLMESAKRRLEATIKHAFGSSYTCGDCSRV